MWIDAWNRSFKRAVNFDWRLVHIARKPRQRSSVGTSLELLEARQFLSAVAAVAVTPAQTPHEPTALEQQMLYDVNRVRVDPQGELKYLFTSTSPTLVSPDSSVNSAISAYNVSTSQFLSQWSQLVPTAPLAENSSLETSATAHSAVMISTNTQTHQAPGEPDLQTRAINAGYPSFSGVGENVYAYSNSEFYGHSGFLIDWGNATPGHRDNIMDSSYQDIGINITPVTTSYPSVGPLVITQDFGYRFDVTTPKMVGVVFNDTNNNGRYDSGEGIGGATVKIVGASGTFTTTTMSAGGWEYPLAAGTYTVTTSGGTFRGTSTAAVTFGTQNREVDFVSGSTSGLVDFKPVAPVAHAPVGRANTVTTLEDTAFTFSAASFGFSDPNDSPANALTAVKLTTLPAKGVLSDNGVAVVAGAFVSVADINAGKLKFTPATNGNGTAYTTFTFQVQDNGNTTSGGANIDATARVMTLNVTPVNDAPLGTSKTATTLEDVAYVVKAADFGFTDPNDSPANVLKAVKLTLLSSYGTLRDNGVAVTVNQSVPAADITGGKLIFTPKANLIGGPLFLCRFQIQDNGGTASGGVDLDPSAKVLYLRVSSVNDAPMGKATTVTISKNTTYVFKVADFGFTDPNDTPPNTFVSVKITVVPVLGSLKDNGVIVKAGTTISVADITSGKLKYTPAANGTGAAYASFMFQVQDNGGILNGGLNTDPIARKLTIAVA